jgi:hypothetical protein
VNTACPTGKTSFDRETVTEEAHRLRLRPYQCPRCGDWHLTRRRQMPRPKVRTLSPRECEGVWSA